MDKPTQSSTDNNSLENLKNTHGGKRNGSGRKAGGMNKETLERKVMMDEFRQRVLESQNMLINSQLSLAKGLSHLYRIDYEVDSKGNKHKSKPILVTDQYEIEAYLNDEYNDSESEYYFITTSDPDNRAIDSLFDRVYGKATQAVDVTTGGEPIKLVMDL